jgi:acetyltransferase-like isoleucine patch superfamily enzyme
MKPNNIVDANENECTWLKSSLPNREELLRNTNAGIVYVDDLTWIPKELLNSLKYSIKLVDNPKKAILNELLKEGYRIESGIHPTAFVDYEHISGGLFLTVGANSTIGGEGFGYSGDKKMPHIGKVVLGECVEIGSNCCIDRGCLSNTVIGDYVKLDNLVHIAHGVKIGEGTKIAAHTMIAGSVTIGKNVWIGPSVSIINGVTIGDNAYIGIGTNIIKDVPAGETWCGNPGRKLK